MCGCRDEFGEGEIFVPSVACWMNVTFVLCEVDNLKVLSFVVRGRCNLFLVNMIAGDVKGEETIM